MCIKPLFTVFPLNHILSANQNVVFQEQSLSVVGYNGQLNKEHILTWKVNIISLLKFKIMHGKN